MSNSLPGFTEPLKLLCVRKTSFSDSLISANFAVKMMKKVAVKLSVLFDNLKIPVRTFGITDVLFSTHTGCFGRCIKNEKITCLKLFTLILRENGLGVSISEIYFICPPQWFDLFGSLNLLIKPFFQLQGRLDKVLTKLKVLNYVPANIF